MDTRLVWPDEKISGNTMSDDDWMWLIKVTLFRDAQLLALWIKDAGEAVAAYDLARERRDDLFAAALLSMAAIRNNSALLARVDDATRRELEPLTKFPQRAGDSNG